MYLVCRDCGRPTRLASNLSRRTYESGLGVLGVHVIKLAMPAGNGGCEKPINPSMEATSATPRERERLARPTEQRSACLTTRNEPAGRYRLMFQRWDVRRCLARERWRLCQYQMTDLPSRCPCLLARTVYVCMCACVLRRPRGNLLLSLRRLGQLP